MKRLRLLLAATVLPLLVFGGVAHADVNDFTVTDFHADETLSRADPQGQLHVVESIKVNFTGNNHGIIRAIPDSYKGNTLKFYLNSVTSSSGAPVKVSRSSSNGNVDLKIGDPNRTVTGNQEYTIDYTLQNVVSFYKTHDELYWDVNGDQWGQPFSAVSVTLHLPAGALLTSLGPECYAAAYGSQAHNCEISSTPTSVSASAKNLSPGQTLTYVVALNKGIFTPMTFWQKAADYSGVLVGLLLPPLFALIVGFIWWFRTGRDAKGRGTIVPEYDPPKSLSPLLAGTVADFKVDNRDITATIIDLARRGYLKITEIKTVHKLRKDKLAYSLTLTKADYSDLDVYETQLMGALFADQTLGVTVNVSDLKNKLFATAKGLRKSVDQALTTLGYFRHNPARYAIGFGSGISVIWAIGFILISGGTQIHTSSFGIWPAVVGLLAGLVIMLAFVRIIPARTALGTAAREHLLGLKMYMVTAEKDRLEKLEGPDAAYAADAGAPVRTVELFESLLPYAIVLGVETQWAGKFKDIYTSPPSWYGGNWTSFNAGYLAGSLGSNFAPAISSSFSSPTSSGSSGFGGGGFSGGGGGGGGGGGW